MERFRARYALATGEAAAALAARLDTLLESRDILDSMARNAFGKTVAEWAQLKARLKQRSNEMAAGQSARGE